MTISTTAKYLLRSINYVHAYIKFGINTANHLQSAIGMLYGKVKKKNISANCDIDIKSYKMGVHPHCAPSQ